MKKRAVLIIIVLCVVVACFALGIIIANMSTKDEEDKKDETNSVDVVNNEEKKENESVQEIVLNSKIGNEVLSKLLFPNLYSKSLYNELEKNGVSNDFKIMYTFSLMTTYQEYNSYLREGEDYIGSYITKKDLESVASEFFANADSLEHKAIFNEDETYNKETGNYVIVARGYVGANLDYIVEVPYQILEYEDRIEVKSYRLYVETESEDEMSLPKNTIYYDSEMVNEASSITDEKMVDETKQQEILKEYIDLGKINKDKLSKSTWTFTKKDGKYLISDYKIN